MGDPARLCFSEHSGAEIVGFLRGNASVSFFCNYSAVLSVKGSARPRPSSNHLGEGIEEGVLACGCGTSYPVVNMIPRMLPDAYELFPGFADAKAQASPTGYYGLRGCGVSLTDGVASA